MQYCCHAGLCGPSERAGVAGSDTFGPGKASTWADPARSGGYGWGQLSHSLAWVFRVSGLAPAAAVRAALLGAVKRP